MYQQYHEQREKNHRPSLASANLSSPSAGQSRRNSHTRQLNPGSSPLPSPPSSQSTKHHPSPRQVAARGPAGTAGPCSLASSDSFSSATIPHQAIILMLFLSYFLSFHYLSFQSPFVLILFCQLLSEGRDNELGPDLLSQEYDYGFPLLRPMQLARAHWIQLHKTDKQLAVLKRMFLSLLQRFPPFRALWPFSRTFDGSAAQLDALVQSVAFQHFCHCYQTAITMLMDNLDDEPALSRLLQEIGSNHFFYDTTELHIRVVRDEFMRALEEYLDGTVDTLDDELDEDWNGLWAKMESNMGFGLKVQRHNYFAHCVTAKEMGAIREQWYRLMARHSGGIGRLADQLSQRGSKPMLIALNAVGIDPPDLAEFHALFSKATKELLWAMEKAISLWEPGTGFLRLCAEIDGRCGNANSIFCKASAVLMRRSVMDALTEEMADIIEGNQSETSTNMHSWTKVYRVAEQAIIADELDRIGDHRF